MGLESDPTKGRTMKRTRYSEEQIIGILAEHEAGAKCADLCRKHGMSEGTVQPQNYVPLCIRVSGTGGRMYTSVAQCRRCRKEVVCESPDMAHIHRVERSDRTTVKCCKPVVRAGFDLINSVSLMRTANSLLHKKHSLFARIYSLFHVLGKSPDKLLI